MNCVFKFVTVEDGEPVAYFCTVPSLSYIPLIGDYVKVADGRYLTVESRSFDIVDGNREALLALSRLHTYADLGPQWQRRPLNEKVNSRGET